MPSTSWPVRACGLIAGARELLGVGVVLGVGLVVGDVVGVGVGVGGGGVGDGVAEPGEALGVTHGDADACAPV